LGLRPSGFDPTSRVQRFKPKRQGSYKAGRLRSRAALDSAEPFGRELRVERLVAGCGCQEARKLLSLQAFQHPGIPATSCQRPELSRK